MLVKEFEGKTEEDALNIALKELNLDRSQIQSYEVINKSNGISFFGFGIPKKTKIKVYYEEEASIFAYKAKKYFEGFLKILNIDYQFSLIEENSEKIIINFSSSKSPMLIGKHGKTLEAIQLWLNTVMINQQSKQSKEEYKKIILDIERYWDRRKKSLEKLAKETVTYVRINNQSKLLPEMSSFERHIIHSNLQNFKDIKTKSEGTWPNKRVRVSLIKKEKN